MKLQKTTIKTLMVLFIYGMAMALVETAVVVYLRDLYYPHGFLIHGANDLAIFPKQILRVELWREAATIVMLATVGYLAFNDTKNRFLAFVFTFSVWDLGYYLFLFIFLAWPASLSTLDVYFLIPMAWIGPVWFPLILFSILGFGSAFWIIRRTMLK